MPKDVYIRITSQPRTPLDADLLAQLVVRLGRELAARAEATAPARQAVPSPTRDAR